MTSGIADFYDDPSPPPTPRFAPARLILNAAHLYRLRVREAPVHEALAVFGIAAGVALLFAVQVASTSITGAVRQLAHGITGKATIEVAARSPEGMNQSFVDAAKSLRSVRNAAPVLQRRITVVGPSGSASLTLVGVDERIADSGGSLVQRFKTGRRDLDSLGLFITSPQAAAIGARSGQPVWVKSGERQQEVLLADSLSKVEIGDLAESPIAIAPLGVAQKITGMHGRISRILIEPDSTSGDQVRRDLERLSNQRFDVRPSDSEGDLLAQALKPDRQSSALFGAIAVGIALLFAFNAMLLALVRRRKIVAYLLMLGADRPTIITSLIFDAVALGAIASILGVVLGDGLSRVAFQAVPAYLATGFPIGSQRIVELQTVLVAFAGGMGTALLASARPAIDLFRTNAIDASSETSATRKSRSAAWGARSAAVATAGVIATLILILLIPAITPVGLPVVIIGLMFVLGPALVYVFNRLSIVARRRGSVSFKIAVEELAGTPMRAAALAVIVASATTAVIGIGGARSDIERGVDRLNTEFFGTSEIWIAPGGTSNVFLTQPFREGDVRSKLLKLPGVRAVYRFRGGYLDIGRQRALVIARASDDPLPLAPSQLLGVNVAVATERIRSGGWIAVSGALAKELGVERVGERVRIPTPTGTHGFRLAAVTTNYGWPSGSIVMSSEDFRRAWGSGSIGALAVDLRPGFPVTTGSAEIRSALGADSGLDVQRSDEMAKHITEAMVQGLSRVRQIAILVLIAAMLAIVAAMFTAVWQRRERLASLRAIGLFRAELYRSLFTETMLIVLAGGIAGVVFGLGCQVIASNWVEMQTGYFTPYNPAIGYALLTLFQSLLLAMLATAGPAYLAARVSPRLSESL
ncbi:MAG: FtsX-like permease family protein [Actinobacteria bacterium]|nr:FtsX-like permease family protein [Actinomycetota bacterium]